MSVSINRDEWLSALRDAGLYQEVDSDSLTVQEYADMMGLKRAKAQRQLLALVAAGKAARTHKRVIDSNGRQYVYTAFKLQT